MHTGTSILADFKNRDSKLNYF